MTDHPVTMTVIAVDEGDAYAVCNRCGTPWSGPYRTAQEADIAADLMNTNDGRWANLRPMRELTCCIAPPMPDTASALPLTTRQSPVPDEAERLLSPRVTVGWDPPKPAGGQTLSAGFSGLVTTPAVDGSGANVAKMGHQVIVVAMFPLWLAWVCLRWIVRYGRLLIRMMVRWEFWAALLAIAVVLSQAGPAASALAALLARVVLVVLALALTTLLVVVYVQVWRRTDRPHE